MKGVEVTLEDEDAAEAHPTHTQGSTLIFVVEVLVLFCFPFAD
jgi:hypothetical protein